MSSNNDFILGQVQAETQSLRRDVNRIDHEVQELKSSPTTRSSMPTIRLADLWAYIRFGGVVVLMTLAAIGLASVEDVREWLRSSEL